MIHFPFFPTPHQYLAAGKVPVRLPAPCMELGFLSLRINFSDMEESFAALCLLRSSPNLQELEMLVSFPARKRNLAVNYNCHVSVATLFV